MELAKLLKRMPKFMRPDFERIQTLDDLRFQIAHEIDLAEEGDLEWTARQLSVARAFAKEIE